MSELKPWEAGYEAPVFDVAAIKSEVGRNAGSQSQKSILEHREAIANGEIQGTTEEIANMTISKLGKHLATRTEDNLSAQEKAFYQDFACEYLRDFDPEMALIRAGGKPKSAHVRGRQMLRTPYCQMLIKRVMDSLEEDNLITRKDIIMGLWREANDRGEGSSGGARVRALMGLARIKQMDIKVVEKNTTITHNVMNVPMPLNNDAWAAAAEQSQAELKSDVRT